MRARIESGSPYEPRYGFCRAIRVGNRVLVAGTAPIPPPGQTLASNAYDQAHRCFEIALEALTELGATVHDVVRTRMYLVDGADADEVGRAHGEVFGAVRPVATIVVVKELVDPTWKVEIELEAEIEIGPPSGAATLS